MIHVTEARHVSGYTIWLRFSDGVSGEVDLTSDLVGEVFVPLQDPTTFRTFDVHPELRTLTWPNGADFAPEYLHERVRVHA